MRALLVPILALAVLSVACTKVEQAAPAGGAPNGVSAQGIGRAQVQPDLALLNLGVQVGDVSLAAASDRAETALTAILDSLRANGVADADLQTSQLSVRTTAAGVACDGSPLPYNPSTPVAPPVAPGAIAPPGTTIAPPESDGSSANQMICVTNTVQARLRDLSAVTNLVDQAISAGGDVVQVNGIQFSVEDPSEAIATASKAALENAKKQAQTIADGMGVGLGELLSVSTYTQSPTFGAEFGYGAAIPPPATGGGGAGPIVTGLYDVIVMANAVYAVK